MNTERNCQSCKYYTDRYCENLELKPCYPQKGCDDFSKQNELKKDTIQVLDKIIAEIEELDGKYVIGDYATYGEYSPKYVQLMEVLQIIDKYGEGVK